MESFVHVAFHDIMWISVAAAGRRNSFFSGHPPMKPHCIASRELCIPTPMKPHCISSRELCIPTPNSVQSPNSHPEQVYSVQYASRVSQEKEGMDHVVHKTKPYAYTEEEQLQSHKQPYFRLF